MAIQHFFNPVNYTFKWTDDGWYNWDYDKAHKLALAARNKRAGELRKEGYKVGVSTLKKQRISQGGIGSGKPHIDLVVNVYVLTVR